jgi:hypothetical protein
VVALAFAIESPRQAITIRPPGTVSMILPVDGLGVGDVVGAAPDVVGDGEVDELPEAPDGPGEVLAEPTGVGVGLGDVVAATSPPTAFPSTQV